MKYLCIVASVLVICASCKSMRPDADADGISRRTAALALLAREDEIRKRPTSESMAVDLVAITKAKVREFDLWGQGETGCKPSAADLEAILKLVKARSGEPILSVTEYPGGRARVNTGEIRGPLDGGGVDFFLLKTGSQWSIVWMQGWLS